MSLASLLLREGDDKALSIDNELDSLFKSQPVPPPRPVPKQNAPQRDSVQQEDLPPEDHLKRKRKDSIVKKPSSAIVKRQKADVSTTQKKNSRGVPKYGAKQDVSLPNDTDSNHDEENNPTLEDQYLSRTQKVSVLEDSDSDLKSEESADTDSNNSSDENEDNDYNINVPPPKHETHADSRTRTKKKSKKMKYVPPDETPAQRDARTVFIGNVPIDVVKSRPVQKQFKRHILNFVLHAKIESMRFRSVAFSAPTSSLDDKKIAPDPSILSTKEKRQKSRAEIWRETDGENKRSTEKKSAGNDVMDDDRPQNPSHTTLTPAQRKRVAFYKHEFHKDADSANAYVVFAHTPEAMKDDSTIHPTEAARLLVEKGNGTIFMSRTLRMDRVGQWKTGLPPNEKDQMNLQVLPDPPCTLFVGNLDFSAKEEDLRTFFDSLLSKERGEPPEDQLKTGESDEMNSLKKNPWVVSVRIIRDRDTQLGKGFAYVRFIDRDCVDEILALEPGSVKFAKRKLRLQRCKGVPGATPKSTPIVKTSKSKTPHLKAKTTITKVSFKSKNTPTTVPKGDPELGTKLASLSKEERKAVKAVDSARLERRLAKKRAKLAESKGKTGVEKLDNKQRHRQRKNPATSKKIPSAGKKGRIRSERSISKRNLKK